MEFLIFLNKVIAALFIICYGYQFLYIPLVLLYKGKKHVTREMVNSYAVLISARNEARVIGQLIDSLKKQTYPQKKISIFVMADNCTDDTAEEAERHGATVFHRNNVSQVGKGYALNVLLKDVTKAFGYYDGYFVFDADNIVSPTFIEKMNDTFMEGHDIITSYRNSKNFSANWLSSGYSLWYLRESMYVNYPRSILGLSCGVSGTGFMFSRKIAEEMAGWPYHLLTEDVEFTVDQVARGRRIAFCREAEIYDEHPTSFVTSWNQRLRWSKGCLQVGARYYPQLITGFLKGNLSCLDMLLNYEMAVILCVASVIINAILIFNSIIFQHDLSGALESLGSMFITGYLTFFITGIIIMISERDHIQATAKEKVLYTFTFPLYVITNVPISFVSAFSKVQWKPIQHGSILSKTSLSSFISYDVPVVVKLVK